MPVPFQYDVMLAGADGNKGYMLTRISEVAPAWEKTGAPDTPERKSSDDAKYGNLPGTIDHSEVWDDWSGGAGYPVRRPEAPNTYDWGENGDTRWPGQLIHASNLEVIADAAASNLHGAYGFVGVPLPSVNNPAPGAGAVLILGGLDNGGVESGGLITRVVPTGLTTEGSALSMAIESVPGLPHQQAAIFGSFVFLGAQTLSGPAVVRNMNAAYSISDIPLQFATNAGSRLALHRRPNEVRFVEQAVNPLATGNWSATYNAGNGLFGQNAGIAVFEQLFVGLPDGFHASDMTGTFINVMGDIRDQRDVDNCRDLTGYEGGIAIPAGSSLWHYRPYEPIEVREIGPPPNTSQVRGRFRAVATNGPWLTSGLFTGSQSHVLVGRTTANGMAWHHMHRLRHPSQVSAIFFDHITTPSGGGVSNGSINTAYIPSRMWVGTTGTGGVTTATVPIYYAPIARNFGNPLLDPTFTGNYMGSMRYDFGADDWGAPGTQKAYRLQEVWADNLASGVRYCDVYYTVDRGLRTYLGRANQSPVSYIPFPTGTINSTEASFNPTLLGWEPVGTGGTETLNPRLAGTALSQNIYLFGGASGNFARSFDMSSLTWSKITASVGVAGTLPMTFPAATYASNGRIYVQGGARAPAGGIGPIPGPTTAFNEYDPVGAAWTAKTTQGSRAAHALAMGQNGRLYSFGGINSNYDVSPSVYEYNVGADTWAGKTPMPTARYGIAAVSDGSFLYVVGGTAGTLGVGSSLVEVYDPANDTWATGVPLPVPVVYPAAVYATTANHKIYVLGGQARTISPPFADGLAAQTVIGSTLVQEYDPTATAWTLRTQTSQLHAAFGAGVHGARLFAAKSDIGQTAERTTATINTGFVNGQLIQMSVESYTATQNITPVYRSFVLRGTMRPKSVDLITAKIRIGDNIPDRQGTPMRPGQTMLAELQAMADSPFPSTLTDLTGATWFVAVQQPISEQAIFQEGEQDPELVALVKMSVMTFSATPGA